MMEHHVADTGACRRSRTPAELFMIGDPSPERTDGTYLGPPYVGTAFHPEWMPSLHMGGGNIGFVDGHVEYFKVAQLLSPSHRHLWTFADD